MFLLQSFRWMLLATPLDPTCLQLLSLWAPPTGEVVPLVAYVVMVSYAMIKSTLTPAGSFLLFAIPMRTCRERWFCIRLCESLLE